MKIIIVEGINGVGKTTLCNKINDIFLNVAVCSFKYFDRMHTFRKSAIEKVSTMIDVLDSLKLWNGIFVIDGFYFSEIIYNRFNKEYFADLDKKISQLKPILVVMRSGDIKPENYEEDSYKYEQEFFNLKNNWTSIQKTYSITYNTIGNFINCLKTHEV